MSDVIIDIETLGVKPNSIICTIGAIKFNRSGELRPLEKYETFYERIDIESCRKIGLQSEQETVKWWAAQNKEAIYEVLQNEERISIQDGLSKLSEFVQGCNYFWSQGSNFDSVILENAYRACGIDIPWKYWQIRDSRTLFDVAQVDLRNIKFKTEVQHHALYDCYRQLIATNKAFT